MIVSFRDSDTETLARGKRARRFAGFELVARRKLRQLRIAARLDDLRIPQGYRQEALKGERLASAAARDEQRTLRGLTRSSIAPAVVTAGVTYPVRDRPGSRRVHGDRGFQFVQKLSALLAAFWRIGTMDSVGQFGHGQRADDDRHIADRCANVLDHVRRSALGSLGRDQDAGIED